jgi:precorrin-6Y C5,15-methyltransferase (decarboxylating)
MTAPAPWLTVIGMGEDGPEGLSPVARHCLETAETVIGGQRLLDRLADGPEKISWTTLTETLAAIAARRGRPTVVVATGDPLWFGLGATLARRLDAAEMTVVPHPGAFSLAAARLGWPLQDCLCLSAHGRPIEALPLHFAPGARLLVLSADARTPETLCRLLAAEGYGPSPVVVLSHLGGPAEARAAGTAETWRQIVPDLNVVAVACRLAPGARPRSRLPGLPDDAFDHDGQITKREIRAATLAALGPWPGARLWDVGAGAGSVAIEWMRGCPGATAVAIEQDSKRLLRIARNALALGVPGLELVDGRAPGALMDRDDTPDAIFVGGGVSRPGLLEACWRRLPAGGRLVANAVTVEAEARLLAFHACHGGTLTRLAVSRLAPVGPLSRWDPLAPVTQLVAETPA